VIMPPFLRSTVGIIVAVVLALGVGAGAVFAWRWNQDRLARNAIESKPAIAENAKAIDTATTTAVRTRGEYLTSAVGFKRSAATAAANPKTSPEVRACYDAGVAVISKCDSMHKADTTLIALYRKRAELMESEAIAARRGKLLGVSLALGYSPIEGAPAARGGVSLNVTDHWSVIGTYDETAKIRKDEAGKLKTDFRPSSFVGLQYHF
jgi:hypothetical protein